MLPDVLWANVLRHLDDLAPLNPHTTQWKVRLMQVCASWRQLLQEPCAWQAACLDCRPDAPWPGGYAAAAQHKTWAARIAPGLRRAHVRLTCTAGVAHQGGAAHVCAQLQQLERATLEVDISQVANAMPDPPPTSTDEEDLAAMDLYGSMWDQLDAGPYSDLVLAQLVPTRVVLKEYLEVQLAVDITSCIPPNLARATTALHLISHAQLPPAALHTTLIAFPTLHHLRLTLPKTCGLGWYPPNPLPLPTRNSSFHIGFGSEVDKGSVLRLLRPILGGPPMVQGSRAQRTGFVGHMSLAQPLRAGLRSLGLLEPQITHSLTQLHLTCHTTESTATLDVSSLSVLDSLQELQLDVMRTASLSSAVQGVLQGAHMLPDRLRLLRITSPYSLSVLLSELGTLAVRLDRLELSAPRLALHGLDDDGLLRSLARCQVMLCTERFMRLAKRMVAAMGFHNVFVFEPVYMGLRGQSTEVHTGWQGSLEHVLLGAPPNINLAPADNISPARTPGPDAQAGPSTSQMHGTGSHSREGLHMAAAGDATAAHLDSVTDVVQEVWPLSVSEQKAAVQPSLLGGRTGVYWRSWAKDAHGEAVEALTAERVRQAQEYAKAG